MPSNRVKKFFIHITLLVSCLNKIGGKKTSIMTKHLTKELCYSYGLFTWSEF